MADGKIEKKVMTVAELNSIIKGGFEQQGKINHDFIKLFENLDKRISELRGERD